MALLEGQRYGRKGIITNGRRRLPGGRVPYAIPGTAYITVGIVSGHKHHDMGAHPGLSCCMYNVCGAGHCSNLAGYI